MDQFKVPTLAVLLQVWTFVAAAAPTLVSNTNSASLNLVNPGLDIPSLYNSTSRNISRQGESPTYIWPKYLHLSSSTGLNTSKYKIKVSVTIRMLIRHSGFFTSANTFPDPYDKPLGGLVIRFYDYHGAISPTAMRDCISAANIDITRYLDSQTPRPMGARTVWSYSGGGVNFLITPSVQLTWLMWALIPDRIQEFVTENEFKGTKFVLLLEGYRPIGFGHLVRTSTSAPTDLA